MRVLYVSHDFLPNHAAGTEIYTWHLAKRVAERGHEVAVFTTEKDVSRPHLRLERREWDGIEVHELVNNLFYGDFRETWDWPAAEEAFARVLDEVRPDVVHFMHLLYLSVGCLEEASRRGLPVFFTLHDFWLQCARFGQRIHADGSVCHEIDFERCGSCLASLDWAQTPLARATSRVLAGVRSATGVDLKNAARRLAGARRGQAPAGSEPEVGGEGRAAADGAAPDPELVGAMAADAAERAAELRERSIACVERFFAPSRFLAARFREWGIPAERIEQLDYGLEQAPFEGFERRPAERVRVGFVGTLAPHTGAHLLLEAWGRVPQELRERASLVVHGPTANRTTYVARLEELARRVGASLPGGLARERVPAALAEIDLLVVPSIWYENQPLTILEALATRTPCLVSDLGGMAELVEEGRDGWRFRPGDADDLARVLSDVLADPERLRALPLASAAPRVKRMEESAAEMEGRYRAALERRSTPPGDATRAGGGRP